MTKEQRIVVGQLVADHFLKTQQHVPKRKQFTLVLNALFELGQIVSINIIRLHVNKAKYGYEVYHNYQIVHYCHYKQGAYGYIFKLYKKHLHERIHSTTR